MPAMQDDRLVGALLAGLPTPPPPDPHAPAGSISTTVNAISGSVDLRPGARMSPRRGYGTFQLGQQASPLAIGLRDHSMRTPGQLQQNFPRELAISEAAALAGIDAIEFRLKQTDDPRLIGVLKSGARGVGLADAPVAGPEGGGYRGDAGVGPGRVGDAALGHLLGVRLPGVGRPGAPAR